MSRSILTAEVSVFISLINKLRCHWLLRVVANRVVAFFLQFQRQLFPAAAHDPSLYHNMDKIGDDIVQQPLVMGNQKYAQVGPSQRADSVRHYFQSINVEAA